MIGYEAKELLGRPVGDGDLVIKPQIDCYGKSFLRLGVIKGKRMYYIDNMKGLTFANLKNCYLIAKPNEEEQKIKTAIVAAMLEK